jgi:hypothetical protein
MIMRMVVDLPEPLGPKKPGNLSRADLEGEVVHRCLFSVSFGETTGFDHRIFSQRCRV